VQSKAGGVSRVGLPRRSVQLDRLGLQLRRGVSSARAIEQLCEHDPAYQWLTAMESISPHTVSDFRADHRDILLH
jgi:hypothetical protein